MINAAYTTIDYISQATLATQEAFTTGKPARRHYRNEFKDKAGALAQGGNMAAAPHRLGVDQSMLGRWRHTVS